MAKHSGDRDSEVGPWTVGLAVFAGSIMLMVGVFQIIMGFAAVLNKNFYAITPNYVFSFDITTWGWIHILIGVVVAIAGAGIFSGNAWGRGLGIFFAIVSAIANFFFIPYYPFWSIMIIILDIAIIGALSRYSPEAAAME